MKPTAHVPYTVLMSGYSFICYNKAGEVLGEFFQKDYPTPADFPAGTVRVDIAIG